MGEHTHIEWCHHSANLWWGCHEVHCGCDNCYARVFARAKGKASAWDGTRFAVGSIWDKLLKWDKAAQIAGEVHRVFCGSMMDIFEKPLPASNWQGEPLGLTTGDLRDRYLNEIVPATPNLLHLLLTKRPGNVLKMTPASWLREWPKNVMVGASVVNQETADTLIPQLLGVPGKRFLSIEPLLGPVDLRVYWYTTHNWHDWLTGKTGLGRSENNFVSHEQTGQKIDWVIVGGESGPKARPMHPDWARSLRDQCVAAGVPFHFKQFGEWCPDGQYMPWLRDVICDRRSHEVRIIDALGRDITHNGGLLQPVYPSCVARRVGKKAAGRLLDGRTWDEFPATEAASCAKLS